MNYQFYSVNGNGAGSLWKNREDEFAILKIANEEKQKEGSPDVFIISWMSAGYNAPLLLLGDAYYCMEYDRILKGDFSPGNKNSILFAYLPQRINTADELPVLKKCDIISQQPMKEGYLLKLKVN